MPIGAGKYDSVCTFARDVTDAAGVLLIVIGGKHGPGFSVTAAPEVLRGIPALLRELAEKIERDVRTMTIHDQPGTKQ